MFNLPESILVIIIFASKILIVSVFINLIFFTTLSFFGLKKPKRDYEIVTPRKKFLFLVPAHNEETVIKDTVTSMIRQNYDSSLYEVVVIADNCTDKTAEIAESIGHTQVFKNQSNEGEPRGKPHAIAKFIQTGYWKNFDYIAFIDADNIVDKNYLMEMNAQAIKYPEFKVIQGYLGMKNVFTSITASGYSGAYFITNRSVQYANYSLGWNTAIGGTGFILDTHYLEEKGWNPRSYTEDFELQVELSIEGLQSGWNHFAKVYDEKPNSFVASHNQRTRWAQGHWFVGITTTQKQIQSLFKAKSLREFMSKIETLFYSYSMMRPVAFSILILFILIDKRMMSYLPAFMSLLLFWVILQIINYIVVPSTYIYQEAYSYIHKKRGWFMKCIIFIRISTCYLYTAATYVLAQLWGFLTWFRPQNNWNKTAHSATFDEVEL